MVKTDSGDFNIFVGMVSFLFVPYIFWLPILVNGLTYDLLFSVAFTVFWATIVVQINKGTKLKELQGYLKTLGVSSEPKRIVNNTGYYNQ